VDQSDELMDPGTQARQRRALKTLHTDTAIAFPKSKSGAHRREGDQSPRR
jgi:hypothetical protein